MRQFSASFTLVALVSSAALGGCLGHTEGSVGAGGAASQAGTAGATGEGGATSSGGSTHSGHEGGQSSAETSLDAFGIPKNAPVGLVGRAVLPAATFVDGPSSGALIGANFSAQPVQGFSCLVDVKDGSFWAMPDNGYGSIENSADFNLRVYRIRPDLKTKAGGSGGISVESYIELRDPDHQVKFAIVNEFSRERVLTGADFDISQSELSTANPPCKKRTAGRFLLAL